MPDQTKPPQTPDHLAPGRNPLAPPDPKTSSARAAANTPLAEDRHAARSTIEEQANATNLAHAE